MIPWEDALERVLHHCPAPKTQRLPALEALGLGLAESIVCDLDSPPYDKSLVDGFAVLAEDTITPPKTLQVLETIAAGQTPGQPISAGLASRIMTGAPLPQGADAVVMVEDTHSDNPKQVVIRRSVSAGEAIMRRGACMRQGEVVLRPGHILRPIEVGLLAEVGRVQVLACARPTVAVLSTGNELTAADQTPGAGQIRNSNGPMLEALARAHGAQAQVLPPAPDELPVLVERIQEGLRAEVLVLSGGVSAGMRDLVPSALNQCGVQTVFHGVRLKPGKPIWFGVHPHGALVFGLPGNPVSSLVCFLLLVRPALARLTGRQEHWRPRPTVLSQPRAHRSDRPTFFPARSDDQGRLELLAWQGSADLRRLVDADCLALLPAGQRDFQPGDPVDAYDF